MFTTWCMSLFHQLQLQWRIIIIYVLQPSQQTVNQFFTITCHYSHMVAWVIINITLKYISVIMASSSLYPFQLPYITADITLGSISMKIVDRSAEVSPKSLFALTTQVTNCLLNADCKALKRGGGFIIGIVNRTVSSLSATVPSALFASCKVSSSSKQKVSHATYVPK